MYDWYLLKKKDDKIYFLKEDSIPFDLLEKILNQNGFELIHRQGINNLVTSLIKGDKTKKAHDTSLSNTLNLICENISSPELKDFFNNLQFSIKPFISILNALNLNFCVCDSTSYILYNKNFRDTIQYKREEIKELKVEDIVFERDLKHLREKFEALKNKNTRKRQHELDFSIITRNRQFRYLKCFSFEINIEGEDFYVNYIFDHEHFENDSPSIWDMNKLIVHELNSLFLNQIKINSVNISIKKPEDIPSEGVTVPSDGWLPVNITQREYEILKLIYKGHSNYEISEKLFISPRTVEYHRSNLLKKTYSNNIVDLIRFAIENNLLPVNY